MGVQRSHLEDAPGTPLRKVVPPGPRAHVEPSELEENVQLFETNKVASPDVLSDGNVSLPRGPHESHAAFVGVPAESAENPEKNVRFVGVVVKTISAPQYMHSPFVITSGVYTGPSSQPA